MQTEFDTTKDRILKVYCAKCSGNTDHVVLQSTQTSDDQLVGYDSRKIPEYISWSDTYQIIKCQGCCTVSFRHEKWNSESVGYYDGTSVLLYPKRNEDTIACRELGYVPCGIRRVYKETIDCYNNDCLTLATVGLRAVIEGICADQKVKKGRVEIQRPDGTTTTEVKKNLEGKISGLCEKGILTEKNSTILHQHRYLGNEAAHQLIEPSREELKLAVEIIEHMLESLYEIPEKGEQLRFEKSRRRRTP
jgi:hypothetical protein